MIGKAESVRGGVFDCNLDTIARRTALTITNGQGKDQLRRLVNLWSRKGRGCRIRTGQGNGRCAASLYPSIGQVIAINITPTTSKGGLFTGVYHVIITSISSG